MVQCQFGRERYADLAYKDPVKRRIERGGNLGGYGDAATQFGSVGSIDLHSVKTIAHPRGGLTCRTNSSNIASARFIANSFCAEG